MRFLLIAIAALFISLPAQAQMLEWSDFDVRVGGQAQYRPDYLGSDDYEFGFAPDAEIAWQKTVFLSTKNGAGLYLLQDPHFFLATSVMPDFGRDESTNDRLNGLGDIGLGWRGNVYGEVNYQPFIAGAKGSFGFGGDTEGQTVNVYMGLRKQLTERISSQMTVGTTWASGTWGEQYYGISSAQAVSSGLPQHDVGSGFRDVGVGGSVTYALTPKFSLIGSARWTHLMGDVADSPIVEEKDNLTLGLGLAWQVNTSAARTNRY